MNDILELLYKEHDEHIARLKDLEKVIEDTKSNFDENIKNLNAKIDEIKFEYETHFKEEEEALFPKFFELQPNFPPVQCMLGEHDQMRDSLNKLKLLSDNLENNDLAWSSFDATLSDLSAVVLAHIDKENNILFQMARQGIPIEKLKEALETANSVRERATA